MRRRLGFRVPLLQTSHTKIETTIADLISYHLCVRVTVKAKHLVINLPFGDCEKIARLESGKPPEW
jgi:hypothetical protein